jgi:hypothetical protein
MWALWHETRYLSSVPKLAGKIVAVSHRRVIETNSFGAMRAAQRPIFERQQHGVLSNVGSILSKRANPTQ